MNTSDQKHSRIHIQPALQPLQRWRRIARIVRRLSGVCIALRKYAMDAGLVNQYLVSVTARTTKGGGTEGGVEELTFEMNDFKVNKEVSVRIAIGRISKFPI